VTLRVDEILVARDALRHPETQRILECLKGTPHRVADIEEPFRGSYDPGEKRLLRLEFHRGAFLKPCPGTRNYICCGYQVLTPAANCPLGCTYCILQAYFNRPGLRIFVNFREALDGVLAVIDNEPDRVFRVGTGEFTDSLALDALTGWNRRLMAAFSRRSNAVIEFKTKTSAVRAMLESPHRRRIIMSWSLNSPSMAAWEERGAAPLRARLEAARACQEAGFVLGFHFDPLVMHPGWREDYMRTLDLLDAYVEPGSIIWVSLGTFRFMPALKEVIRRRHPRSRVLHGEFVRGLDGKMRYIRPLRVEMLRFMSEKLKAWDRDLGVYLCMESDVVWQEAMGWTPRTSEGLSRYLDARVRKFFG